MKNNIEKKLISKVGEQFYSLQNNNHIIISSLDFLYELCTYVKNELDFILLLDICAIDNLMRESLTINSKRFELVYHFLNMETHQRLRMRVPVDEEEWIPSIKSLWSNAWWYEREVVDLMQLKFDDSSYKSLFQLPNMKSAPLRKDFKATEVNENEILEDYENILKKEFDPTVEIEQWVSNNSMINGMAKIQFWFNKNKIKKCEVDIGYHHRGLEKKMESLFFNQSVSLTDELNFFSAAMNNIAWCKAVEEHLNLEINDRAKGLRMIFIELSRVADHLNCLGNMGTTLDVISYEKYCLEHRERIYELF